MSIENETESVTNVLENMIPANEQAVEQVKEMLPFAVMPSTSYSLAIPEEEKAVEDEEYVDTLTPARAKGFFSTALGMSNINDRVCAAISIDKEGRHYFVFCERYSDGTFSPKMQISQSDLFTLSFCNSKSKNPLDVKMKNKAISFLVKLTEDYLSKFRGGEPLDILSTLNDLITARHILPVCDNQPEVLPAEEFYREIMKHISLLECTKRKAYYGLDIGGIEYLAHKMKMKKVDLLSKLKEYNFLYLTKSSRGYQTNVRFKIEPHEREVLEKGDSSLVGKEYATAWMYCIYKMEYLGNAIEE